MVGRLNVADHSQAATIYNNWVHEHVGSQTRSQSVSSTRLLMKTISSTFQVTLPYTTTSVSKKLDSSVTNRVMVAQFMSKLG